MVKQGGKTSHPLLPRKTTKRILQNDLLHGRKQMVAEHGMFLKQNACRMLESLLIYRLQNLPLPSQLSELIEKESHDFKDDHQVLPSLPAVEPVN